MTKQTKHAWVTGSKRDGYTVCTSDEAYAAGFQEIGHIQWGTYRMAQDIANAVKLNMSRKGKRS